MVLCSARTMFVPVCVIFILTVLGATVRGQTDVADASEVKVKWGIPDGMAHVGRLYRMHVPSDAFSGEVLSYSVTTAEGTPLAKWLNFDEKDNVLVGIPTHKSIGDIAVRVLAKGATSEDFLVFTINVKDLPSLTSGSPLLFKKSSGPEVVRCKRDEPETVATIVIDIDLEATPVADTVTLLNKFLGHMDLQHEMVKIAPVGNSPFQDSSALVSGPGDSFQPKTAGTFLSWPVGCGQVKEGHFKILQRLDDDSRSSQMAKVIGCPVIGWHVSNSHLQPLKRKRRQVVATATASMTPVMSTKTGEKTDDAGDKMTREVPERSSAVIQPTATQPMMSKTASPEVMPTKTEKETPAIKPSESPMVTTPTTKTKELPPIQPTATVTEGTKTQIPEPGSGDACVRGAGPALGNPFKRLDYTVGDVIGYEIPADTFEDCEVGGTRGMNLNVFLNKTVKPSSDFFVQFDQKNQKMIGLPMKSDVGRYKMRLVGQKDTNGLVESFYFNLVVKDVKGKDKKKVNHELSVSVDYEYDKFMSSVEDKTDLANKIANVFGDPDASNLVITKIDRGSVVLAWTNRSVSSNDCPVGDVKKMVGKLVNDDNTLNQEAIEKLKPFYLSGAASAPSGACEGNPDFPVVTSLPREKSTTPKGDTDTSGGYKTDAPVVKGSTKDPDASTEPMGKSSKDEGDSEVWLTTIVPIVVVAVIIIIALLIACVLYRKKRKGKMNVEEQNTFINKGAPVIFPDELEDKPNDVNKPLLVEGSPAPPPQYHRGTSESPDPEANNHRNGPTHDDGIHEMPERPYDPPPPVATSSNNKQPRPTQQPMSQHPQILP